MEVIWLGAEGPLVFCIGRRVLNLFCASGWELCSTEVELSVLIESSYSVGFVGSDFCNTFVFIRDSGLCLL